MKRGLLAGGVFLSSMRGPLVRQRSNFSHRGKKRELRGGIKKEAVRQRDTEGEKSIPEKGRNI